MTDAGYPAGSTVQIVLKQHANAVTRTTVSHLRLETEKGERIDLKSRLKRQPYGKARHIMGWVKAPDGERYQVRLVAYRLPKEVAVQAGSAQTATVAREARKELQSGAGLVGRVDLAGHDAAAGVLV